MANFMILVILVVAILYIFKQQEFIFSVQYTLWFIFTYTYLIFTYSHVFCIENRNLVSTL